MSKRSDKETERSQRKYGEEIYAIDLLVSTWRHLSKLHEMGLSQDTGERYLKKARDIYRDLASRDVGFLNSDVWLRLSQVFHGA